MLNSSLISEVDGGEWLTPLCGTVISGMETRASNSTGCSIPSRDRDFCLAPRPYALLWSTQPQPRGYEALLSTAAVWSGGLWVAKLAVYRTTAEAFFANKAAERESVPPRPHTLWFCVWSDRHERRLKGRDSSGVRFTLEVDEFVIHQLSEAHWLTRSGVSTCAEASKTQPPSFMSVTLGTWRRIVLSILLL
jgi:hypothetical protein